MGIFKSKPKKQEPKNKNAEISERDRAMLEVKRSRDRLRKYRSGLEITIAKETTMAREFINKKEKQKAVYILRKKRYQEKMLDKADKQLLNIEQMIMQIQSAVLDKELFDAMKIGKQVLDALQAECSVEDVEDLMADVADGIRLQEELSSTLSTHLNPTEMAALESEVEDILQGYLSELDESKQTDIADTSAQIDQDREDELAKQFAELPEADTTTTTVEEKPKQKERVKEQKAEDIVIF